MKKFQEINAELAETMKSHLIEDLEEFGILIKGSGEPESWEDDYEKFFDARAKAVSRELSKRIIKQGIDERGQPNLGDDLEEELTTSE
ncbi:hypothetical protein [Vacuolonema iberomarrocanum]|uniref:hypothetical protein n=1 Tax=Vacuolonema iberomarrocanum TaxID=3454632 RepID=UPI001A0FE760|nr:hypothetical protein [filamentous cyanobacterium LEGE 07170]